MKRPTAIIRLGVGLFSIAGLAAVAMLAQDAPSHGDQMAAAATGFLDSLSDDQRKQASFAFDDPHRTAWFFTPQQDKEKRATRKGIRFEELGQVQREKALALLKSGTSAQGYEQATTIMSLEGILREVDKGPNIRNPNWYFISVFGTPSKTGKWGWRIEGHHMSVSFTLDRGQVESPTPFMFGANPATVKGGAKDGLRTLPAVEDAARDLIASLDADQRKAAQQPKPFAEIAENTPSAKVGEPVGLAAAKMSDDQKSKLGKLLAAYTDRMPANVAAAERKKIDEAGFDKLHFGYSGTGEAGKPWTYQVQGPTFVAQFLNVQADGSGNPNNHIHSAWRKLPADFGLPR